MEPSALIGLKHLLKAPSRKAVEELILALYKTRNQSPIPQKFVDATSAAFQISKDDAKQVIVSCFQKNDVVYENVHSGHFLVLS